MVAAVAAIVLRHQELVGDMAGLWRGEDYASVYRIPAEQSSTFDYFADEMHGHAVLASHAPDGADLGTWRQTEMPTPLTRSPDGDAGYSGTLRLSKGPTNGYGKPAYYIFERQDRNGFAFRSDRIYYLGKLEQIRFAKTYSCASGKVTFPDLESTRNRYDEVCGSLTYTGRDAQIQGRNDNGLLYFNIVDFHTGLQVGHGCLEWTPDSTQIEEFSNGKWGAARRAVLAFTWTGNTGPNGVRLFVNIPPKK